MGKFKSDEDNPNPEMVSPDHSDVKLYDPTLAPFVASVAHWDCDQDCDCVEKIRHAVTAWTAEEWAALPDAARPGTGRVVALPNGIRLMMESAARPPKAEPIPLPH